MRARLIAAIAVGWVFGTLTTAALPSLARQSQCVDIAQVKMAGIQRLLDDGWVIDHDADTFFCLSRPRVRLP